MSDVSPPPEQEIISFRMTTQEIIDIAGSLEDFWAHPMEDVDGRVGIVKEYTELGDGNWFIVAEVNPGFGGPAIQFIIRMQKALLEAVGEALEDTMKKRGQ